MAAKTGKAKAGSGKTALAPHQEEAQTLAALCRKAEHGDRAAAERVKAEFDAKPSLWSIYDLGRAAERTLIQCAAGNNEMLKEGIHRRLNEIRREVGGPHHSPLEALLAERIALCWLQVTYAEAREAQGLKETMTLAQSEHQQRRTDRAHKRLHAAVKSLALVRRLGLPAVQVNIAAEGGKQVNIAQAMVPSPGSETAT